MRVNIDKNGRLTIHAETEIESYTLKKWHEDWLDNKAVFTVKTEGLLAPDLIVDTQGR